VIYPQAWSEEKTSPRGGTVKNKAIENERGTLSKAESLLRCLVISLEYDDADRVNGPYYPDVAEIARKKVIDSINLQLG
jgi:hypothetical protein